MFRAKIILATFLLIALAPASAMNQEGHDSAFITEFLPGILLLEAIPEARPLPSPRCPVTAKMLAKNVYEQIQLPRHRCSPTERGILDATHKP
jgi:hypothetical protein